jgi:hemolysin activation/secretion protein
MIRSFFIATLLTFTSSTIAQDVGSPTEEFIVGNLEGVLLLGDWNFVRYKPVDKVQGVVSEGISLLDNNYEFLSEISDRFVDKPLTQHSMKEMKQMITDYYESENQPLVVVSTPNQEVTNGVLQLVVTEARLGQIHYKGNRYFTSQQLGHYIRARKGQPIVAKDLYEDLSFMNLNPFRRTDAVFTPGARPGLADIELLTVDRWPYRFYVGSDNTGTPATGRNRIFFGVNLGKTIVEDSEISYQYTQAPNGTRFFSHTGNVRVPLPWFRHVIQAFGGYSSARIHSGVSNLKPRGVSWQVDLRYRFPINYSADILQEVIVGYDYKESNTNLIFGGESQYRGMAAMNQFMIGYTLGNRTRDRKISLNLEAYGNPTGITDRNDSGDYRTLRNGAKASYIYAKASHSFAYRIDDWWLSYDLTFQYSPANLLPSEQLTLTGYYAVRGFEERVLSLDNGGVIHLTAETPHISPVHWMGWCKHYDELYLVGFIDTAFGANHDGPMGISTFASLGSIGPSLRYQISRYFSAHLDYGIQLWHSGFTPSSSRYNFGLIVSY